MTSAIVDSAAMERRPEPTFFQHWSRELFGGPVKSVTTLVLLALIAWALFHVIDWGVVNAVFHADATACRAVSGEGACWGVVAEKFRSIMFGRYTYDQQWRPAIVSVLLIGLVLVSTRPRFWKKPLVALWIVVFAGCFWLMRGGLLGLPEVPTRSWGGLPLTLGLSIASLLLAFPPAIFLALGRRSDFPVVRTLCATYIEIIRGVPLISVLFMASFILPLLAPGGWRPDVLWRVLVGISMFVAAYLAETVRGGLQAVPVGQLNAAVAMGMSRWQVQRFILLPQALRYVVPSIMNIVISTLKDSSLVTVVGLYELTGALSLSLGGDPEWRPFYLEGYLYIAAVYWVLCFGLSRYSHWIEKRLAHGAD